MNTDRGSAYGSEDAASDLRACPRSQTPAGIVLVGGASRRLGRDKALLPVGGVPVVAHIVRSLRPLVSDLLLVGGSDRFADVDARWVPDTVAGAGPLGGMISGLTAVGAPWAFVLACDVPLVRESLLRRLLEAPREAADAVVPRHAGGVEPLVALYARRACQALQEAHMQGERAIHRVLERLNVVYVEEAELRGVDPDLDSFLNVNTDADVVRLSARLAKLTAGQGNDTL